MNQLLLNQLQKDGRTKIRPIPANKRPTIESLTRLENEISSKLMSNDVMRSKSLVNAGKSTCR